MIHNVIRLYRRETIYFEEGGSEHTDATIDLAYDAARELGIEKVVVASTTGKSGVKVAERFIGSGVDVIVVGHQFGYPTPGQNRFNLENMNRLKELGARVCLSTDVLTTPMRQRERLGPSPLSVITQALIMMKIKVNVEVVVKAADNGIVVPGERVISLTGSHLGLDTAIVLEAQESSNILDIQLREIITMPLSRRKANEEYMKSLKAEKAN